MAENISNREAMEPRMEAPKAGATFPDILKRNKFVKYAVAAVLAGTLSSCAADETDYDGYSETTVESKETQAIVPRLGYARDVQDARKHSMDILKSDKSYSVIITSENDVENPITIEFEKNEGIQTADITFDQPTYRYAIDAYDEDGNPVEINKTKKPGTIYGKSVVEFTEGTDPNLGEAPSE